MESVAEYLARGGQVTQCKRGESGVDGRKVSHSVEWRERAIRAGRWRRKEKVVGRVSHHITRCKVCNGRCKSGQAWRLVYESGGSELTLMTVCGVAHRIVVDRGRKEG